MTLKTALPARNAGFVVRTMRATTTRAPRTGRAGPNGEKLSYRNNLPVMRCRAGLSKKKKKQKRRSALGSADPPRGSVMPPGRGAVSTSWRYITSDALSSTRSRIRALRYSTHIIFLFSLLHSGVVHSPIFNPDLPEI